MFCDFFRFSSTSTYFSGLCIIEIIRVSIILFMSADMLMNDSKNKKKDKKKTNKNKRQVEISF